MTQTEIARRVGVSQPTVSLWQRGLRKVSPSTERRLRQAIEEIEGERRQAEQAARQDEYLARLGRGFLETAAEAEAELTRLHSGSTEDRRNPEDE